MITSAYLLGWEAFEANEPYITNPYDEFAQSLEYCDWLQGYKDAEEAYDG